MLSSLIGVCSILTCVVLRIDSFGGCFHQTQFVRFVREFTHLGKEEQVYSVLEEKICFWNCWKKGIGYSLGEGSYWCRALDLCFWKGQNDGIYGKS